MLLAGQIRESKECMQIVVNAVMLTLYGVWSFEKRTSTCVNRSLAVSYPKFYLDISGTPGFVSI